jgi:glucans biosynthesis protein C
VPLEDGARLAEIDWLRVGAIFLVFVVHVAQIFSPIEDWHIASPETSWVLGHLTVFLGPWIMPLFMLLAGAAAWFARRRRRDHHYLRVRAGRLLVPLLAGTFLLVPPQVYLRRLSRGEFEGSFPEFLPRFFDGVFPEGNFSYGHLWFIAYLFVYMVAALPIFQALDREGGRRGLAVLATWMERPGGIFLPAIPIVAGQLLLRGRFTQSTGALIGDWATHAWLFPVFLIGYVLLAEGRLMRALEKQWVVAFLPGLALSVGMGVWASAGDVYARLPGDATTAGYFVFWTAFGLLSWCWLAVVLGAARRFLTRETALLRWATPLVYPFYIFHQTVIVGVAYVMVGWPLGVHLRFLLIGAVSLAGTLAAIELTRRVPGLRNLVGLQPRLVAAERPASPGSGSP